MLGSIKKSNDLNENRTRDLPTCSIIPQPTPRNDMSDWITAFEQLLMPLEQNSSMKTWTDLIVYKPCGICNLIGINGVKTSKSYLQRYNSLLEFWSQLHDSSQQSSALSASKQYWSTVKCRRSKFSVVRFIRDNYRIDNCRIRKQLEWTSFMPAKFFRCSDTSFTFTQNTLRLNFGRYTDPIYCGSSHLLKVTSGTVTLIRWRHYYKLIIRLSYYNVSSDWNMRVGKRRKPDICTPSGFLEK
jgi:hypothetical protein